MKHIISIIILSTLYHSASAACSFPSDLTGIWANPSQGNLTFNDTHMTGYDIDTYTDLTLECHLFADDKYVLRSTDFTLLGLSNVVNAAFCISLTKESSSKYTFFIQTTQLADANNERVMFIQSSDTISSVNDICNDTAVVNTPQNTKLLVKYGESVNEAVRCPNDILGTYWYYNHTTCTESYWDVCSVTSQMTFNYTMCSEKQLFSAGAAVRCLYNVEDNDDSITYIYNEDATVDNSATYQYSCMIVKKDSDGLVYVTQYPGDCLSNQTSTYVVSSGQSIILSANVTCVPSSETSVSNAGLIAGLVVLFLVILGGGGAALGYYIYKKKFKKVDPEKQVIDKEKTVDSKDSRVDAVTPSVVKADMTSPRNGGSHGKHRHKRIGIKKVDGPAVPLPPVKTHPRNRKTRNFASKSLITPRDIRPPTRKQSNEDNENPNQPSDEVRDNAPIVEPAPPDLQLTLSREETFTGVSRCSTAFEDKIGFTLLSEKSNVSEKSIKRPSKSRQSNVSRLSIKQNTPRTTLKSQNGLKQLDSARSSRKSVGLSVKSLNNNKNSYVKHAKAVFKDRNMIYKKKIKLVGKIKKKRPIIKSAASVKLDKVTKEDITGKPKQTEDITVKDNNTVDESAIEEIADKVPDNNHNEKTERPSQEIKEAFIEKPVEHATITNPNTDDENFFMCSNEDDNEYAEFMEKRKKEQEMLDRLEKQKYLSSLMNLSKDVPIVSKRAKIKKSIDKSKGRNTIASLVQNVETFARFSVLRQKFSVKRKNDVSKEQKEAAVEEKILTQVYVNMKTKSKIQLRRRRARPSVDLKRNISRVPTLVDWVECSDVLSMPTMKMQNKLKDNYLNYDNVKNLRYKVG